MPDQIMLRIQSHNVHSTLYNVARSDMIYTVRAGKALLSWQILHISHQSLAHSQPASQKTHKKPSVITQQKKTGRLTRA